MFRTISCQASQDRFASICIIRSNSQNKTICGDDPYQVAKTTDPLINSDPKCGVSSDGFTVICQCDWIANSGAADPEYDGRCYLNKTNNRRPYTDCTGGTCFERKVGEQECNQDTGFFTLSKEAIYTQGNCSEDNFVSQCQSGEVQVPCKKNLLFLPFFSLFNFVSAMIALVIIYFFISRAKLSTYQAPMLAKQVASPKKV